MIEDKVKGAILNFFSFKSPGSAGVYPPLLQWGLGALPVHLVGIFSISLALKYILKSRITFDQNQEGITPPFQKIAGQSASHRLLKDSGEADQEVHKEYDIEILTTTSRIE